MSSFDKVVKLACKPKPAPPKAKYLEPIIAATWSEEGAVGDVCKALSPRFREPNAIVVFKALIVLHTMMRSGATDNVLSFLCTHDVLRLRNVSAGNWEGYSAPQNLQHYAIYLDSRIRAYSELKHDAIRVQAENNRDMRNSNVVDDELGINVTKLKAKSERNKTAASAGVSRSKTVTGRKLRIMTVEKGLLRETKAVHRMIDSLVECRFYLDDLEDELTTTALRMLVKDLLILFQAGNEGVINLLEHYFEMSHVDAEAALKIYKHFCKQTEKVVEFLGVARKLQNLLNVSIPNLKHAPVSLASALQEYLDDPNFEQNRVEYKVNKQAVDKGLVKETDARRTKSEDSKPSTASSASAPNATASSSTANKNVIDFFAAIEEEQPTMFNPATNSPNSAYFQQQQIANPFVQRQMTGMPMQVPGQPTGIPPQQTGFMMSQQTGMNPFGLQPQQQLQPQPTGHRPFSSFLPESQMNGFNPGQMNGMNGLTGSSSMGALPQQQPQQLQSLMTGMPSLQVNGGMQANANGGSGHMPNSNGIQLPQFPGTTLRANALTPQMTGSNPFRASSVVPQATGFQQQQPFQPTPSFGQAAFGSSSFGQQQQQMETPARPMSAPLGAMKSTSPPPQPVKTHQTGTKNPFGPVVQPPPPVPKVPTLMELAMGYGNQGQNGGQQQGQQSGGQQTGQPLQLQTTGFGASLFGSQQGGMGSSSFGGQQQQQPSATGSAFGFNSSALNAGPSDISSVASSFAFDKKPDTSNNGTSSSLFNSSALNPQNTSTTIMTQTTTTFSDSLFSHATGVSSQPTGASSALKPQITGFQSSLKPFKPSSSFGASLLESLPPIPGSNPGTPAVTGQPNGQANSGAGSSPFSMHTSSGSLGSSAMGAGGMGQATPGTGSSLGVGLRPQMTGGANPFRPQTISGSTGGFGGGMASQPTGAFGALGSQPTGAFGGMGSQPTGAFGGMSGSFGQSAFGQSPFGQPQQQQQQQQQQSNQPPTASLI
ncbi:ANTH domain-containing protein [Schizophyllum amplum]|uniref:ANTH domain-containing protein n=1 Tax=Schizophyllum amplum TaxID=97359 RepID=A0A550C7K7_9AGAR|nr:ANTH domain-containing protein [Auriculariopsis ampla]